ncbi:MAG: HD domain-containing protein [Gemmatimonadota bacterium]|nr:HD domain-containing protein [Gemmatimonadota bacterium]
MSIDLRFLDSGKAIRDPIWGHIHIPEYMIPLVDAEEFQRLRDISQLGHVLLVYPGARHSRFEHSLGVFHIAGQFLRRLVRADPPPDINIEDARVLLAASLLHDIGHYPFCHVFEEMQMFFSDHEERGRQIILDSSTEVNAALRRAETDPLRVANVIDYRNNSLAVPDADLRLAHILSGTLDPDKIDYLLRDARYCGVPFGESVNRDRLLGSITFDPAGQRPAITYKGVSAVEALIFTSYLMYRNVYWHHAVRSANAMFKRGVQDLLHHPDTSLGEGDFNRATEADLIHRLELEMDRLGIDRRSSMIGRLKRRKLHKVARIFFPHERETGLTTKLERLYYHPVERRQLEIDMCAAFGAKTGLKLNGDEILIDIPRLGKSPEVNLNVYFGSHIPLDKADPLRFDDPEVSMLKEYLIGNFETQAKVVRIFCADRATLREALKAEVIEHIKSA